jgi:hypothetical protein
MRSVTLASLCLLTACGPAQFQQEKLNDGSFKVTCELSMDECVRRAGDLCRNQRYRILEGTSETRLRDAPPFERAYHTSRLHLACTNDGADVLFSLDKPASADKPATDAAKATAPLCSPGETRTCVGAGACQGGQACSADGKSFGACDCGPAPAAGAAAAPAPADAVTPAAPEASPSVPPVNTGGSAATPPTAPR